MTDRIEYLLWAEDRKAFLTAVAMIQNPLAEEPPFIAVDEATGAITPMPGLYVDEVGEVMVTPPVLDEDGNEITPAEIVPGHHVNLLCHSELAAWLTEGMPTEGTIGETTKILELIPSGKMEESAVGEPAGYMWQGTKWYGTDAVHTRSRVWA
jgi:hypothetical protein